MRLIKKLPKGFEMPDMVENDYTEMLEMVPETPKILPEMPSEVIDEIRVETSPRMILRLARKSSPRTISEVLLKVIPKMLPEKLPEMKAKKVPEVMPKVISVVLSKVPETPKMLLEVLLETPKSAS